MSNNIVQFNEEIQGQKCSKDAQGDPRAGEQEGIP